MSVGFNERSAGRVIVLDISGRLDLAEGRDPLKAALDNYIRGGPKDVLLNFADVSFIDGYCIDILRDSAQDIRDCGGDIKLINFNTPLKNTLHTIEIKWILTSFYVFESEEAGLRSFRRCLPVDSRALSRRKRTPATGGTSQGDAVRCVGLNPTPGRPLQQHNRTPLPRAR